MARDREDAHTLKNHTLGGGTPCRIPSAFSWTSPVLRHALRGRMTLERISLYRSIAQNDLKIDIVVFAVEHVDVRVTPCAATSRRRQDGGECA